MADGTQISVDRDALVKLLDEAYSMFDRIEDEWGAGWSRAKLREHGDDDSLRTIDAVAAIVPGYGVQP